MCVPLQHPCRYVDEPSFTHLSVWHPFWWSLDMLIPQRTRYFPQSSLRRPLRHSLIFPPSNRPSPSRIHPAFLCIPGQSSARFVPISLVCRAVRTQSCNGVETDTTRPASRIAKGSETKEKGREGAEKKVPRSARTMDGGSWLGRMRSLGRCGTRLANHRRH